MKYRKYTTQVLCMWCCMDSTSGLGDQTCSTRSSEIWILISSCGNLIPEIFFLTLEDKSDISLALFDILYIIIGYNKC